MRHVGKQRTERHDELDLELPDELQHEARVRLPTQIRLDAEHDHRVAVETRDRGVEEGVRSATRACASGRPRARRSDARPGSRRSSPTRSRRTTLRPTASRDSCRRASLPGRRRSSLERRRGERGGAGRAATRRSAPTFPESSWRRSGARHGRPAPLSRRRARPPSRRGRRPPPTARSHRCGTEPLRSPSARGGSQAVRRSPAAATGYALAPRPGPGCKNEEHDPERGDGTNVPVDGGIERPEPRHDVASRCSPGTGRLQSRPCRSRRER